MALADIERELIGRGYRILYRRPDAIDITTYPLARDGATMGFRITDMVAAEMYDPVRLVDKLEKEWHPRA